MRTVLAPAPNESELQAEFYHQCRLAGIVCRLEITTRCGRPDALICTENGGSVYLAVECKVDLMKLCDRQLYRYRGLRVPVLTLCAAEEIPGLLDRIRQSMEDFPDVPWSDVLP